ncbi:MAG: FGGY family carbohydrate kinase [Granulosicoccus sp.]
MKDVLIGIDAGTSVIKSVAFTLDGEQLADCSIANVYQTVDDACVEQDMLLTWQSTVKTLLALAEKVPQLATRTAAISITGQGDGTWLVDKNGHPVADAWLWLDGRAGKLVDEFKEQGQRDSLRYSETATGLAACQQGAQMMWMKEHSPDLLTRTDFACHCKDWLYFNLTGAKVTDPSEGTFTFGNFRNRSYSDAVIEQLQLEDYKHLLPDMMDGVNDSTPLSKSAASITGLLEGTPVVLGYVDVICTALGAGLYDPVKSPGCTIVGSTGMHMYLVRSPDAVQLNDEQTGYLMPMPIAGCYAQMQSNMASTLNIDWLMDVAHDLLLEFGIERSRAELVSMIETWIGRAKSGEILYQPYISEAGERGPFIDVAARAGFTGLSTQHRFPDLVLSVVEGLAFAARDCYQAMGEVPDEIRLTGGAARSASLRQVFGAVLGTSLRTCSRTEAGAAGAAMMAAVNIGHYRSMDECVAKWVEPLLSEAESADSLDAARYSRVFPSYCAARDALRPIWHEQAAARRLNQ